MKLEESFRVENAAIVEAMQVDTMFLQCQLELVEARQKLGAAVEAGDERLELVLSEQHRDLIVCRIALLRPHFERALEEEATRLQQLQGTAQFASPGPDVTSPSLLQETML